LVLVGKSIKKGRKMRGSPEKLSTTYETTSSPNQMEEDQGKFGKGEEYPKSERERKVWTETPAKVPKEKGGQKNQKRKRGSKREKQLTEKRSQLKRRNIHNREGSRSKQGHCRQRKRNSKEERALRRKVKETLMPVKRRRLF